MHAPPTFWAFFTTNLRLQVLFTILPVVMMIVVRDLIGVLVLNHLPGHNPHAAPDNSDDMAELVSWIAAAGFVFMVAPELLRRVLRTQPLRDGPMRRRLEAVCRRANVRYREILFWDTDHTMGNAAVMGIIPWMRYILLSDVLIESMTDDQIEAVFAHEVGHVVHRHMVWFVVFFGVLFSAAMCVDRLVENTQWFSATSMVIGSLIGSATAFWLGLGFLSRRFERQADVFAARMIQKDCDALPADASTSITVQGLTEGPGFVMGVRPTVATACLDSVPAQSGSTYVGHYGAALFGSALHRVARVNNIPIARNEWLHGSIAKRMQYLRHLSTDPALTIRFDRIMARLYGGLVFALIATTVWLIAVH